MIPRRACIHNEPCEATLHPAAVIPCTPEVRSPLQSEQRSPQTHQQTHNGSLSVSALPAAPADHLKPQAAVQSHSVPKAAPPLLPARRPAAHSPAPQTAPPSDPASPHPEPKSRYHIVKDIDVI